MKLLVKFFQDWGRNGNLEGLFIVEKDDLEKIYGEDIYFGEVLGKHSDVQCVIEEKDFKILTDDQPFIEKLREYVGYDCISGINPVAYWNDRYN